MNLVLPMLTAILFNINQSEIFFSFVYLSKLELQLQCCLQNLRIACKAVQVAIPLGELKLQIKNGGNIKNLFTIYESYDHQRACPTIPLSGQSNLVRQYFKYFFLISEHANTIVKSSSSL
jgi:hypothetical protein